MTQVGIQIHKGIDSYQCRENRTIASTMEQWSILSNALNYIQYDKHPKNFHNLGITAVNICKNHSDLKEKKDMI